MNRQQKSKVSITSIFNNIIYILNGEVIQSAENES